MSTEVKSRKKQKLHQNAPLPDKNCKKISEQSREWV